MKRGTIAAAGIALLLLAGCGRGQTDPNQPSADERSKLDNIAAKQDSQTETFDTSADSLVPANEAAVAGNGANAAVPAGPAPANTANQAAPR